MEGSEVIVVSGLVKVRGKCWAKDTEYCSMPQFRILYGTISVNEEGDEVYTEFSKDDPGSILVNDMEPELQYYIKNNKRLIKKGMKSNV